MTREEREKAIAHGKEQLEVFGGEHAEFIKLAIEALEQEPCEDCVSRRAVLYLFNTSDDYNWGMSLLKRKIEKLPPVTPKGVTVTDFADKCRECGKQKKGKWIIDDEEKGKIWHCHCSNCKKDPQDYIGGTENWWLVRLPDHCPKCGLEMECENGLHKN